MVNGFSLIVTFYSLALFLLIEGCSVPRNQIWFDLKLVRQIQSRTESSRQRGLCLVRIVDETQNFEGMFQVLRCIVIFINKKIGFQK